MPMLFLLIIAAGVSSAFEVTDALGRTLKFERPPERIVIAGRAHLMVADAVYLFPEVRSRVKAVERVTQGAKNFIPLIDTAFGEKKVLPVDAGPEEIASVRPDCVLMKSYMRNKLGKPLENLGLTVFYLNFESPEEYLREIAMLGKIAGSPDRSSQIIASYRERLRMVEKKVVSVAPAERPAVLFVSYTAKGGTVSFNVPPRNWLQPLLIEYAGGRPVWQSGAAQQGWQKIGFEQIAAWDPDYIIVTSYFSNVDDVTTRMRNEPLWTSLNAVKKERLLGFPGDFFSWDQPDTRWILGLLWMAKVFHPDLFPNLDMNEEIKVFYKEMYGMETEAVSQSVLPLLRGDIELTP